MTLRYEWKDAVTGEPNCRYGQPEDVADAVAEARGAVLTVSKASEFEVGLADLLTRLATA